MSQYSGTAKKRIHLKRPIVMMMTDVTIHTFLIANGKTGLLGMHHWDNKQWRDVLC